MTGQHKPEPADITDEITAMSEAYHALAELDEATQDRCMQWLRQRLNAGRRAYDERPF
jgi:hypothetical protein